MVNESSLVGLLRVNVIGNSNSEDSGLLSSVIENSQS